MIYVNAIRNEKAKFSEKLLPTVINFSKCFTWSFLDLPAPVVFHLHRLLPIRDDRGLSCSQFKSEKTRRTKWLWPEHWNWRFSRFPAAEGLVWGTRSHWLWWLWEVNSYRGWYFIFVNTNQSKTNKKYFT